MSHVHQNWAILESQQSLQELERQPDTGLTTPYYYCLTSMLAAACASSQVQSVCASSFIPDWSRATNLEDTVSTILLFGKDFESFFLIARSHHTIRQLQNTQISASTGEKMKEGLSLRTPPAISCTEDTTFLGSVCVLQQQKHCYSMGFSPGNKNQQSIMSSWQKLVKSNPHPSNQNGTKN